MYVYECKLVEVIDGDTVDVDIDLGFDVWMRRQRVRLAGINAPEIRTRDAAAKARGLEAKARLGELLRPGALVLACEKYDPSEKYGRILGRILVGPDRLDANAQLLAEGHAVPFRAA